MNDSAPHDPAAHDPLLGRLADADPALIGGHPSADSEVARHTLADALAGGSLVASAGSTPSPTRPFGAPPAAPQQRTGGRRIGYLVGAAAAMTALAGGVLTLAPSGSTPALAAVQQAAGTTASVDEGVMTTRVIVDATDGSDNGTVEGEIVTRFDQGDLAITADIISVSDSAGTNTDSLVEGPEAEAIFVDGIAYARSIADGEGWYGVQAPDLLTSTVEQLADPRSILEVVDGIVDASEDGTVTVEGTELTRYVATVDLSDETLRTTGPLSMIGQLDISPTGTVEVVLLVDGDVLRSMTLSGTAGESTQPDASATFQIEVVFTELGQDQAIAAPEGAEILDLEQEFGTSEGD